MSKANLHLSELLTFFSFFEKSQMIENEGNRFEKYHKKLPKFSRQIFLM